ncbi:MAG TPA: hypothetical protein P5121_26310 [Caldilineaceae bacterium]|nr:hypothetical protein [Caldilineaceae bacterium]
MSKTKAKARRHPKTGRSTAKYQPSKRLWLWSVAIALPVLILVAVLYSQRDRASALTSGHGIPPATLAESIATSVAIAEAETKAPPATDTAHPQWPVGPADYCRRHPRFARQLGFDERAILTTSSPAIKGLALIQPADAATQERVYQDPTWDDAGYLGHMTFDPNGNVYVFPSPRVSLIDNPPEQQNTLYRVDSDSAQMSAMITLTADAPVSAANPFGLMGTTYDCDTASLYAATVAGSTASEEIGKIVRIDLATEAVVAELQGIDPFGLSVLNVANKGEGATPTPPETVVKRLYYGAARSAEVYSILLNERGDFVGQPTLELALPNSTLKPWRIVWDTNGDMIVRAMPFDFNLIATSERIEIPFRFHRDAAGLWQWVEE